MLFPYTTLFRSHLWAGFVALLRVPNDHLIARVRCGDSPAVRAKRQAENRPSWHSNGEGLMAERRVPYLDRFVAACGSHAPAVWTKGNALHIVCMPLQRAGLFTGLSIPEPDGIVIAGRGQNPATRAEGNAMNVILVSFERLDFPAGFCIP